MLYACASASRDGVEGSDREIPPLEQFAFDRNLLSWIGFWPANFQDIGPLVRDAGRQIASVG